MRNTESRGYRKKIARMFCLTFNTNIGAQACCSYHVALLYILDFEKHIAKLYAYEK